MKSVKGYHKLYNKQKKLFDETYKKHLVSLDAEERVDYMESQLREVSAEAINIIRVSFNNGKSFLYLKDNKWTELP